MTQPARHPEPYIDAIEAARLLGLRPDTVRRMARSRKIPSYCPSGEGKKPRLYLASELRSWMDQHAVGGQS